MASKTPPAATTTDGKAPSVLKADVKDGKDLPKKKFAADLWDRFDQVFERITRGRHDLKTIKTYMETRAGLEESYGKQLEKLEKVGVMQEDTSLSQCFKDAKDGAGNVAKQHIQFAIVSANVAVVLDKVIKEMKTTKTKLKDNHTKLTTDEKTKTSSHMKARQAYADAVKQTEQATTAYKEGKRTNVLAKQLEKLKGAMKDKVKHLDKCFVEYKKCAEQLRHSQETLYRETCVMLQQFEDLELRRLTVMHEQFEKFAQQHDFLKSALDQIAIFLHKGTDHVHIKKDIQDYIQKVTTGKEVGKYCEFVPITSTILAQDPDTNQPMTPSAPPPGGDSKSAAGNTSQAKPPAPANNPPSNAKGPAAAAAAATPAKAAEAAPAAGSEQQAQALYDFDSSEADELPFKAGDLIKVYSAPDDNDWWQGEFNGKVGIFPKAYVQLLNSEGTAAAAAAAASATSASAPPAAAASGGEGEGSSEKPAARNGEPAAAPASAPASKSEGGASGAPEGGSGAAPSAGASDIKFMDATCDAVYDFDAQGGDELSFKAGEALIITGELNGWYLGKSKDGSRVGIFPSNYVGNVNVKT